MSDSISFQELYEKQQANQNMLIQKGKYDECVGTLELVDRQVPFDEPRLASYHIQQLISEVGEVLDADKRWKSFRNGKNDTEGKLEEIADCFIVTMNVAMYSGFTADQVAKAISEKMDLVADRIKDI